jgi:hypothetical protein
LYISRQAKKEVDRRGEIDAEKVGVEGEVA